jgi:hypothetical protein
VPFRNGPAAVTKRQRVLPLLLPLLVRRIAFGPMRRLDTPAWESEDLPPPVAALALRGTSVAVENHLVHSLSGTNNLSLRALLVALCLIAPWLEGCGGSPGVQALPDQAKKSLARRKVDVEGRAKPAPRSREASSGTPKSPSHP